MTNTNIQTIPDQNPFPYFPEPQIAELAGKDSLTNEEREQAEGLIEELAWVVWNENGQDDLLENVWDRLWEDHFGTK